MFVAQEVMVALAMQLILMLMMKMGMVDLVKTVVEMERRMVKMAIVMAEMEQQELSRSWRWKRGCGGDRHVREMNTMGQEWWM